MIELETACKDPAELFIQILAHTQGNWTVASVIKAVEYIEARKPQLKAVE